MPPARHAPPRATAAYGTGGVLRLHLRTAWRTLLAWPLGLAALVLAIGRGIVALYPSAADRAAYAASATITPGAVAFNGRWTDLHTLGGITANEVGFMGLVVFPLAGVVLAVGRTRREEDSGRIEALTARPVGRLAPLAAAALAIACAVAGFVLVCAAGLVAVGLPAAGSLAYAALLAATTLTWAGIGLLCAEVCRDARTATGLGLGLILVVFVLRAAADGAGWDLAWATPMGWLPEAAPFGERRRWPYAALLALAAATTALAVLTAHRRDLSGGLLAPRPGPARAPRRLGTPAGYAWRLTRPSALGWLVGLAVWGGCIGLLTDDMTAVLRGNPQLLAAFGIERPEDVVTSLAIALGALGAAAVAVQGVTRLAAEEDSGRLALVLAAPVSRRRLWLAWAAVIAAEVAVVMVLQALVFGMGTWVGTGARENLVASLGAALVLTLPALAILAASLALRGLAPGWAGAMWVAVAWGSVVAFLAETLDLPGWARDLSPFHLVGEVPLEDPRWGPIAALALATLTLTAVAVVAADRRDLRAG